MDQKKRRPPVLFDRPADPDDIVPPPPAPWRRHVTPWRIFFLICLTLFVFLRFIWPQFAYEFPLNARDATAMAEFHAMGEPLRRFPKPYPVRATKREQDGKWIVALQSVDPAAGDAALRQSFYIIIAVNPDNGDTAIIGDGYGPPPADAGLAVPGDKDVTERQAIDLATAFAIAEPSGLFSQPVPSSVNRRGNQWIITMDSDRGDGPGLYMTLGVDSPSGKITVLKEGAY